MQTTNIKKYDKYKDSGIDWIGEIPQDWNVTKIGQVYDERNEKVSDKEYAALSVTKNGIVPQLETAAKTDNGDNRKLVKNNDFVINSRSDRRGSCGISEYNGSVSLINTVLAPRNNMCNKYYNYTFKSECFADEFYKWGNGIVDDLWSTKWSAMKNIYIPHPTQTKQQQIVDYLDNKCGKIDRVINTQKNIIEKLKEYKQAVITEAVTKGLDNSAKLKDSGIEWIGKIPEQWEVKKLKQLISKPLQYGANESGVIYNENYPRYIRITDIKENNSLKDDGKLSLLPQNAQDYILENDDILFARSGATVGKTFIYKTEYGLSAFAGYLIRACLKVEINASYIYYFTLSSAYEKWKDKIFIQATIQNIGANKYNNMEIVLPQKTIQDFIVDYLDKKCSEIDTAISEKEQLIEKLTEYKKSLIYECVTGKRKVA